ncbi:GDSL esterase/lipase 7-like [Spinacia oleracea]|uniref:GDSL esterase/lipase 7-like n=1 Tax=Spinacia oleracea TaxID=3562 RepID=A0ABM3R9Y1_SPIOL|nr:GDSL esterase/lipase 7-like [Spinacia oleracea]
MSPKILISIILILSQFFWGDCGSSRPLVPALYVFGDSLFDGGNNNWLPTLAKANYPPYGQNFPKGQSTGRFTNGKLVVDFIAEYLGLPYPPPYVMPSWLRPNTLMGYNYASGACGILPETGKDVGWCLSLDEQMRLFERSIRKHLSPKLSSVSQHLAKSIFIFSTGNNDYLGNYFGKSSNTRQRYDPQQFTQLLIDALSLNLQKLYKLGARKVVVFELGPLGCLKSILRHSKPNGRCDENVNQIVLNFNSQLSLMLKNLTSTLENSHFILGHAYWLGYDAIINPGSHGLSDSRNPCCKTLGNGTPTCIPVIPEVPLLQPCSNANQHFFWDDVHPSEAINSVIASTCITGSSVCLPLNIQQLVQV